MPRQLWRSSGSAGQSAETGPDEPLGRSQDEFEDRRVGLIWEFRGSQVPARERGTRRPDSLDKHAANPLYSCPFLVGNLSPTCILFPLQVMSQRLNQIMPCQAGSSLLLPKKSKPPCVS